MEPQYLNETQIANLAKEALNPIWRYQILAAGHRSWCGIFKVSQAGLIHFYGNTHTGWQHIIDRHGYYSEELYFGKDAIGNPTKFNTGGLPVIDWTQIADDIYKSGTISEEAHKDEGLFIKYTGKSAAYPESGGIVKDFILILYRNTKIVHSLFPKKHLIAGIPKPKLTDIKKAFKDVTAETTLLGEWLIIHIPYVNSNLIVRYVIIFRIYLPDGNGEAHLQVNRVNGAPVYSIYKLAPLTVQLKQYDVINQTIEFTRFLNSLARFDDLGALEDVILEIEDDIQKAQPPSP